jgi:hypothetical protein
MLYSEQNFEDLADMFSDIDGEIESSSRLIQLLTSCAVGLCCLVE